MKKIRILAIAPYEGLKEQISECAQKRSDIEINIFVGDLDHGAELARTYPKDKYDIIISRGGTAEMIQQHTDVPVINILPTVYDLLRVIRLAKNYDGKFAVVGFHAITNNTNILFDLLQQKVDVFTINHAEEAKETITKLKKDGYSLIIGDAIAISISQNLHLNGILITSGHEGINHAFDEAIKINDYLCKIKNENADYNGIFNQLKKMKLYLVKLNEFNHIIFSTLSDENKFSDQIIKHLKKLMNQMTSDIDYAVKYLKTDNQIHKITGHKENNEFLFFIHTQTDYISSEKSIFYDDGYPKRTDHYPFDNIGEMQPIYEQARIYSKTDEPIHVIAPAGTDTEDLIGFIHRHSKNRPYSYITIDCSLLDKKDTFQLFHNENSFFNTINMTIFFKHFDQFDTEHLKLFSLYANESALLKRNRIIFETCEFADNPEINNYLCENECLKLYIPFLSQRKRDIPSLISLYINYYNLQFGKHVINIEPEAIDYLTLFPWKRNIEQLRQIVKNMVLYVQNDTITVSDVHTICNKEIVLNRSISNDSILLGTLHEINQTVIQNILNEENGNKSKTAERLGISRSTLWRLLNSI